MKTILFVHHSSELYGADKVLLALVKGLDGNRFRPVVALPSEGPLSSELRSAGITTVISRLLVVGRKTVSLQNLAFLPFALLSSMRSLSRAVGDIPVDIVHSNTLAVLTGAFWARAKRIPHVWHVHEMIERPLLARRGLSWLLLRLSSRAIFISHAVRNLILEDQPGLTDRSIVIWNGLDRNAEPEPGAAKTLREEIGLRPGDVLVALVGRFNRWKGQRLLVEAADILWGKGQRNIHYLFVGSPPPGQDHYQEELLAAISSSPAKGNMKVMGFRKDIWPVWDACDIAVVPSTEPEPFGLVALEAMAAGKPVVASNLGGLPEIVMDRETGLLFEPGSAQALAAAVGSLSSEPGLRSEMGRQGWMRQKTRFTFNVFLESCMKTYHEITGG